MRPGNSQIIESPPLLLSRTKLASKPKKLVEKKFVRAMCLQMGGGAAPPPTPALFFGRAIEAHHIAFANGGGGGGAGAATPPTLPLFFKPCRARFKAQELVDTHHVSV